MLRFAWFQASIQGVIVPARVMRCAHSSQVVWKVALNDRNSEEVVEEIVNKLSKNCGNGFDLYHDSVNESRFFAKISSVKHHRNGDTEVVMYLLTKNAKWLDKATFLFHGKLDDGGFLIVDGFAESTGMIPLSVPFAPLLNIALCFYPFRSRSPGHNLKLTRQEINLLYNEIGNICGQDKIETLVIKS